MDRIHHVPRSRRAGNYQMTARGQWIHMGASMYRAGSPAGPDALPLRDAANVPRLELELAPCLRDPLAALHMGCMLYTDHNVVGRFNQQQFVMISRSMQALISSGRLTVTLSTACQASKLGFCCLAAFFDRTAPAVIMLSCISPCT